MMGISYSKIIAANAGDKTEFREIRDIGGKRKYKR